MQAMRRAALGGDARESAPALERRCRGGVNAVPLESGKEPQILEEDLGGQAAAWSPAVPIPRSRRDAPRTAPVFGNSLQQGKIHGIRADFWT